MQLEKTEDFLIEVSERMKIFLSGLFQETNSFSPIRTDIDTFKRGYLLSGTAIRNQLQGSNTEIGGFFDGLESDGGPMEIVPGQFSVFVV